MQGGFSYQNRITSRADAIVLFQFTFSGSRHWDERSPMNREVLVSDQMFHMFRACTLQAYLLKHIYIRVNLEDGSEMGYEGVYVPSENFEWTFPGETAR